jgi:23S rRNA pseudouridine1911/1915/1917 synthase
VAIRKLKLRVTSGHAHKPLNEVLAGWLTEALGRPVSKAKARKLLIAGAVFVDRRRITIPSQILSASSTIEASVDVLKLFGDSASRDKAFELNTDRILFEDEDLIVVDKPAGLPTHATQDESRDNLFAAVGRFLSRRDGDEPYLGVHQRLDRDTSGVVLFTKTKRVNAAIAKSFSEHAVSKIYHAITHAPRPDLRRKLKREWTIKNHLGKISSSGKRSRYGTVRSDGQFAETAFRVIEAHSGGAWIEAIPRTGRTHQIRVHLSEYGLPIIGDDLYGVGEHAAAHRLMLHAVQLVFRHPIATHEVVVKSELPIDFKRCLREITL